MNIEKYLWNYGHVNKNYLHKKLSIRILKMKDWKMCGGTKKLSFNNHKGQ